MAWEQDAKPLQVSRLRVAKGGMDVQNIAEHYCL